MATRYSALNIASPWRGLTVIPGEYAAVQRAAALYLYSGLVAIPAAVTAGVMTATGATAQTATVVTGARLSAGTLPATSATAQTATVRGGTALTMGVMPATGATTQIATVRGGLSVTLGTGTATAATMPLAVVRGGATAGVGAMSAAPATMPVATVVYTPPGATTVVAGTGSATAAGPLATISGAATLTAGAMVVSAATFPVATPVYTPPGVITFLAGTGTAGAAAGTATVSSGLTAGAGIRLAAMNIASPWRHLAVIPGTTGAMQRAATMYLYTGLVVPGAISIGPPTWTVGAALLPATFIVPIPLVELPGVATFRSPLRPREVVSVARAVVCVAEPRQVVLAAPARVRGAILAPQRTVEFRVDPRDDDA